MKLIPLAVLVLLVSACTEARTVLKKNIPRVSEITVIENDKDELGFSGYIEELLFSEDITVKNLSMAQVNAARKAPKTPTIKSGSGFFVSPDGHIMTNNHVVEGSGNTFIVTNSIGIQSRARLAYKIPKSDVAILKVNTNSQRYIALSDKMSGMTGDKIFVAGYPLSNTLGTKVRVTDGIVSADVGVQDNPTYIQISAPIQPGNSGGPIVSENFTALGIATMSLVSASSNGNGSVTPQNVNFGVKVASVLPYLDFERPENTLNEAITLDEVMNATVLIMPDSTGRKRQAVTRNLGIKFSYRYYWDVVVWQVPMLNISVIDLDTGTKLGKIVVTGEHLGGKSVAFSKALNELRNMLF